MTELLSLGLLDSAPEERFDRVTRLAKRIFGVDVALVTLVDAERQWFLSKQGTELDESPRETSFCTHAISSDDVMHVADASVDPRFADNPLVIGDPRIRFYAGQPIHGPQGSRLGTLCLIDSEPRELTDDDATSLRDLAQVVEAEVAAAHLATVDALTGLSNRRGFETVARKIFDVSRRLARPVSMLYADLDGLKQINDAHGHAAGDRAIVGFAAVLEATFRSSDVVARLGGDEFVVLLTAAGAADSALDHLASALEDWNRTSGEPFALAASVGTATVDPTDVDGWPELIARADAAMYERKRLG